MRFSHRSKNVLLIASLAFNFGVCLAFGMQSFSHAAPPEPEKRDHGRDWDMGVQLGLTAEQEAAFNESRDRMFTDMKAQWAQLADESDALTDLLVAPELDEAAIAAQIESVSKLRNGIHERFIAHFVELRSLLTPEQLTAFSDFIKARCGGRRGPFHGSGPGEGRGKPWERQRPEKPQPDEPQTQP